MRLNTCDVPTTDPLVRQQISALLSDMGSIEDLQKPYATEDDVYRDGAYEEDQMDIAAEM